MPTYEYACRGCNEHIEVVQSFTDEPLRTCTLCGGSLRKVFSAAGIIFKGSGYYVTDTRDGGKKAQHASADGDSASSDGSSSDSDSSPEKPTDSGSKSSEGSSSGGTAASGGTSSEAKSA